MKPIGEIGACSELFCDCVCFGGFDVAKGMECAGEAGRGAAACDDGAEKVDGWFVEVWIFLRELGGGFNVVHIPDHINGGVDCE